MPPWDVAPFIFYDHKHRKMQEKLITSPSPGTMTGKDRAAGQSHEVIPPPRSASAPSVILKDTAQGGAVSAGARTEGPGEIKIKMEAI